MIEGTLTTSAIMALIAAFLTQAVKQAIPEQWYRYIPLPLGVICVGVGMGLAAATGNQLVPGAIEGIVAAALAVFGYDMVKGFVFTD